MQYDPSLLYKTYSRKVYIYLCRLVNKNEAEDLMQEVFIKVFKSLDSFKGDSQISTWIYKIATNTAIDRLKSFNYKKEKDQLASLDYIETLKHQSVTHNNKDTNIEYKFFKQEMNQCIADYINKLPDNYRTIFLLREYDNLSVEEIAEIIGISVDNVKIRLHRAKKTLHKLLLKNCNCYYDEYSNLCCDRK